MILGVLSRFEWTWAATAFLAALTYWFVKISIRRRTLPPGPAPWPLVGNLLNNTSYTSSLTGFAVGNVNVNEKIDSLRKSYGDVFTVWVGSDPSVVVCGWDRLKEGLVTMKNAFSGRMDRFSFSAFVEGHKDIMFTDFSAELETLRKLVISAVRKYAVSEKLNLLVDDVVRQVLDLMVAEKEAFDPHDYLYLTIYNIIASTAFGKRYDMKDEEFLTLMKLNDDMNEEINFGTVLDVYPVLRHVLRGTEKRPKYYAREFKKPLANQYKLHKETYTKGVIRDFIDSCLAAKEEAELEDKESAKYFPDPNMVNVLFDFFMAGSDTSRVTLTWIILYLAQYPEIQEKVRQEVLEKIGDRPPVQEDKRNCPYTSVVIAETLRTRPVISFTLEHKSTRDVEFAGYAIPKDTSVMFHILSQHMDNSCWKDAQSFRPERFLEEDGTFMTISRFTGYLPFGLGRRACPGEKLALADLFLILAGIVKKVRFSLPDGAGSADLQPINLYNVNVPKPFKINVHTI